MLRVLIVVLALGALPLLALAAPYEAAGYEACAIQSESGRGWYDLSPLAPALDSTATDWPTVKVTEADLITLYASPCTELPAAGRCAQPAAGFAVISPSAVCTSVGELAQRTVRELPASEHAAGGLVLEFSGGETCEPGAVGLRIIMKCNPLGGRGAHPLSARLVPMPNMNCDTAEIEWPAFEACPQASGRNWGLVGFLLFGGVGAAYFTVGMVLKSRQGATGVEMLPNHSFWLDLPVNINEGVRVVMNKCKGTGGESYSAL